jgi:hypothetical protein
MKVTTNGTPGADGKKLRLNRETVRNLRVRSDLQTGDGLGSRGSVFITVQCKDPNTGASNCCN